MSCASERDTGRTMPDEPTTPDLVELVRGFAESAPNDLDSFLRFFADDAVWDGVPLGTSFRGLGEIRRFLTDWMAAYAEYEIEEQEVREVGNGVVLAVVQQMTRLAGSANPTRMKEQWVFVFVWIDDAVAHAAAYQDLDQALAAAERLPRNGGRRCRRTLTSCARSTPRGNAATTTDRSSGHTPRSSSSSWTA